MTPSIAEVPQTGRQPTLIAPESERRLLRNASPGDQTDSFALDPHSEVRRVGRLALRRDFPDPNDYFALGDQCARLTLNGTGLDIHYIERTLEAYARAGRIARDAGISADAALSLRAQKGFVSWLIACALHHPTPRNTAAALWAAATIPLEHLDPLWSGQIIALSRLYIADMGVENAPPAPADTEEITPPAASDPAMTMDGDQPEPVRASSLSGETVPLAAEPSAGVSFGNAPTLGEAAIPARSPRILSYTTMNVTPGEYQIDQIIAGRYVVRGIKRGGMGVIYLCVDQETNVPIAIKTFQSRFLDNPRTQERFRREALVWIDLEKHPNVVQARKVETFGEEEPYRRPHLLMEYVVGVEGLGTDLSSWIERRRIDPAQAAAFGAYICAGMQHAVTRYPQLVHRDLKPANILVRYDGIAKVTDFGLVRAVDTTADGTDDESAPQSDDPRLTRAGTVVGTIAYLSPEQCQALPLDLRSDIYAFGAILFEMLTGRQMFERLSSAEWLQAHLYASPQLRLDEESAIPQPLRALMFRCLAKAADDRPESWASIRDELDVIHQTLTGAAIPDLVGQSTDLELQELLDKAYSLTELGYSEDAIRVYDRALERDPHNAHVWARKGRTLRVLGEYEASLKAFEQSLTAQSSESTSKFAKTIDIRAWTLNQKGIVHERLHQFEEAYQAYTEAVRRKPELWHQANLIKMLLRSRKYQEAQQHIDALMSGGANYPDGHILKARMLLDLEQPEKALISAQNATSFAPRNAEAWIAQGECFLMLRRPADAVLAFAQASRCAPRNVRVWMYLASAHLGAKNFVEAHYAAGEAVRLKPNSYRALARLGRARLQLERPAEALDAFEQALSLEPQLITALEGKAEALEALGRLEEASAVRVILAQMGYEGKNQHLLRAQNLVKLDKLPEALEALQQALLQTPKDVEILKLQGLVFMRQHRYDEAAKVYQRAVELAPEDVWNHSRLVNALIRGGDRYEALDVVDAALETHPDSASLWGLQGRVLRDLHRPDQSLQAYDRALQLEPESASAWIGKGLALVEPGQRQEALACFQRASALSPELWWAWYQQGVVLIELGRYGEAIESLNRALMIDPHNRKASVKRDEARKKNDAELKAKKDAP